MELIKQTSDELSDLIQSRTSSVKFMKSFGGSSIRTKTEMINHLINIKTKNIHIFKSIQYL